MGADGYNEFISSIDSGDRVTITDNAQFMSVLKTLSEFYKNKLLYENSESTKYTQAVSLFAQQKAPILMMGTWIFGTAENDIPGINFGVFHVPNIENANTYYAEPGQITCVVANSKNVDAAKKWVNLLASVENASFYISRSKMTPTVNGVSADFTGAELLSAANQQGVNVLPITSGVNSDYWSSMYFLFYQSSSCGLF